jgi:hypothetical protein
MLSVIVGLIGNLFAMVEALQTIGVMSIVGWIVWSGLIRNKDSYPKVVVIKRIIVLHLTCGNHEGIVMEFLRGNLYKGFNK